MPQTRKARGERYPDHSKADKSLFATRWHLGSRFELCRQGTEGRHGHRPVLTVHGPLVLVRPFRQRRQSWPRRQPLPPPWLRSEEHTSELQSHLNLVCRLLLEKKKRSDNA